MTTFQRNFEFNDDNILEVVSDNVRKYRKIRGITPMSSFFEKEEEEVK